MVDFYYKLVIAGKLTIEQVPEKYREKVKEKLGDNHE